MIKIDLIIRIIKHLLIIFNLNIELLIQIYKMAFIF